MAEDKELKEEMKRQRSLNRLKKAFYVLFVLYIFAFFLIYAMRKDVDSQKNIAQKVGIGNIGVGLSMRDALLVKDYSINKYKDLLIDGDYEGAYALLTDEYKELVSFEEYKADVMQIDAESIDMKSIKSRSSLAYEAEVVYTKNGEEVETTYLLFPYEYNPKYYTISPDKFICCIKDQEFKKDHMVVTVDRCIVYTDKVELEGKIKNEEWKGSIVLSRVAISSDRSLAVWEEFPRTIGQDGEIDLAVTFKDTTFFIPNSIMIEREKAKVDRIYLFRFKEEVKK